MPTITWGSRIKSYDNGLSKIHKTPIFSVVFSIMKIQPLPAYVHINDTRECICNNKKLFNNTCLIHWMEFAKKRYNEVLPCLTPSNYYTARITPALKYEEKSFYLVIRNFFSRTQRLYQDLRYFWVKHLNRASIGTVHLHILMWNYGGIAKESIRRLWEKVANKYTNGYKPEQFYIDDARKEPSFYLAYCLGLVQKENPYSLPPWGDLSRHVLDGNAIYRHHKDEGTRQSKERAWLAL